MRLLLVARSCSPNANISRYHSHSNQKRYICTFLERQLNNAIYADKYPRAFSYVHEENLSVRVFLTATTLHETFQLPLSMQAHEELKMLQLDVMDVTFEEHDDVWSYCWGSTVFKTATYYQFFFRDVVAHMAFRSLWRTKCTPKIKVFGWFLLSDRLNTRNMLKRRHYNIGSNLDCLLCGLHVEEMVEHLFFIALSVRSAGDLWVSPGPHRMTDSI